MEEKRILEKRKKQHRLKPAESVSRIFTEIKNRPTPAALPAPPGNIFSTPEPPENIFAAPAPPGNIFSAPAPPGNIFSALPASSGNIFAESVVPRRKSKR